MARPWPCCSAWCRVASVTDTTRSSTYATCWGGFRTIPGTDWANFFRIVGHRRRPPLQRPGRVAPPPLSLGSEREFGNLGSLRGLNPHIL